MQRREGGRWFITESDDKTHIAESENWLLKVVHMNVVACACTQINRWMDEWIDGDRQTDEAEEETEATKVN